MVRHFRLRVALGAVAGALALAAATTACGSSTGAAGSISPGFQALNAGGTPRTGGTLNMIGISDVDYLDYDTGYYSSDSALTRAYARTLYAWPAVPGKTTDPAPDLATGMPVVSDGGLKQTVTIRPGVMWNTSPARAVTAQDVVRGIKRACNPSPVYFGGMVDFESTIVGLSQFCSGYPAAAASNAGAMKKYIESHNVPGISVSGNSITFTLTKPAPWLLGAMTMPPFSAVPVEAEKALPGTPGVYNHMYSDGPYTIASYTPKQSIKLVRNPVWKASTDPLRKAYVDAINIDETGNQSTIFQQVGTGSAALGMTWDALVPPADDPNLLHQIKAGSKDVNAGATYSSNPYMVFNTVSPNNGGALGKATVRQALEYGIQRSQVIKSLGGPDINLPLTHVLPSGIDGAQDLPANYNPYPYDAAKAKSLLASAGYTSGHPLALKLLYRSDSEGSTKAFNNISAQLNALGSVNVTGIPTNQSDFYGKYLTVPNSKSAPSPAYKGVWDAAIAGWAPDWFGDSAVTYFNPLYSSPGGFPTNGGSNFGYYQSPAVDNLITQALSQPTESQADTYWAKADQQVMSDAAVYPIDSQVELAEHAPYVHNAVYIVQNQQFDMTNVWLSTPGGNGS